MRVELTEPESVAEPRLWVEHQQVLALVLRPGSVEWASDVPRSKGSITVRAKWGCAGVMRGSGSESWKYNF
jgi:hypothetical protein